VEDDHLRNVKVQEWRKKTLTTRARKNDNCPFNTNNALL
jgi:hypothetical protein